MPQSTRNNAAAKSDLIKPYALDLIKMQLPNLIISLEITQKESTDINVTLITTKLFV